MTLTARRVVYNAYEVTVGDVVAYPAVHRERGRKPITRTPASDSRDWLRVTRVEGRFVYGIRVNPQDWERDYEFAVYPLQIEENGLVVAS